MTGPYPNLPNLPGNTAYTFTDGRKSLNQSLKYVSGYAIVHDQPKSRPQTASQAPYALDGKPSETGVHVGSRRDEWKVQAPPKAQPPAWLTFDRKVLKFEAYFKEAVHDSAVEHWRVRKCHILHYLEDGSTQVEEPKESNSGLCQGTLLKRHRILLGDGNMLRWSDLSVGAAINLYNRVFMIYACDSFTRDFMARQGHPQPADQPPPTDPYHNRIKEKEELAREVKSRVMAYEKLPNSLKYLENARKVLRFWACWDDTKSMFGDKMPFVIQYYLADDTMEVREVHLRNDGRDPFPHLVRRMRMPKKNENIGDLFDCMQVYSVGVRPMSANTRKHNNMEYYSWQDLGVGKSINIYGREMLLTSADDFTRDYYIVHADATEADFLPIQVDYHNRVKRPVMETPPAWMGLGRDEDTIGNVNSLIPKQPKPDLEKTELYGNQALRFLARFRHAPGYSECGPADAERHFVVSFFLATDEVFVYEPPIRNAGIVGGKFLERTRVFRPGTRTYYAATDFFVGARLPLVSRLFELVEADAWTLDFMEARPGEFPWASFAAVMWRLRRLVAERGGAGALREAMMDADRTGSGLLSVRRFHALLNRLELDFSLHEVITLSRHLHPEGKGIDCEALLQALDEQSPPSAASRHKEYHLHGGAHEDPEPSAAMQQLHMEGQASPHGAPAADAAFGRYEQQEELAPEIAWDRQDMRSSQLHRDRAPLDAGGKDGRPPHRRVPSARFVDGYDAAPEPRSALEQITPPSAKVQQPLKSAMRYVEG